MLFINRNFALVLPKVSCFYISLFINYVIKMSNENNGELTPKEEFYASQDRTEKKIKKALARLEHIEVQPNS